MNFTNNEFPLPLLSFSEADSPFEAKVVADPLRPGFGVTLGVALRRVLLSSMAGFAVTSMQIPGIVHEFSSLPGVREDLQDVILNIKSLVLRSKGSSDGYIYLNAGSEGKIVASMIDCGTGFEVVNKDLLICNLSKNSSIEIKMRVQYGIGYVQSSKSSSSRYDLDGIIPVDAIYNPLKRVNFSVEQSKDVVGCERLIMHVETDGSISPEDAVFGAAKIVRDQFTCSVNSVRSDSMQDQVGVGEEKDDILSCKIESVLELSVRAAKCLKSQNILSMNDLVEKKESDLLKAANFGKKSLDEIKAELSRIGLSLGMREISKS